MIENGGITRNEFQERMEHCLSEMKIRDIDLIYVYGDAQHPENLIYLTNYQPICTDMPGHGGYNAVFLLFKDASATLIIDRDWYIDWAKEESWVDDIIADSQGDTLGLSFEMIKTKKLSKAKVEVDIEFMPVGVHNRMVTELRGCEMDTETRIVRRSRETKTEKEIELISRGLEILGKAHDVAVDMGKEGVSEIDIAQAIRRTVLAEGADYMSALMVLAGPRSTIPLAFPMHTDYKLKNGDMVSVSIFCTYKKYSAGMDRNWVVGEASEKQRKLAEIELKSLEKSISLVKPGVKATDFMKPVYADFVEPLLKEAGFTNYNIQGYVGHGTGIATVECPVLWKLDPAVLRPGMVIDMEPGIYSKDPSVGGLRTADFVVVKEDGCQILTKYPRRIGTLA